jgi:hypothetical protein
VIVAGVSGVLSAGLMNRTAPLAGSLAGQAIRTSIFGLQQPSQVPASLHARLIEITKGHAPQLGFAADIKLTTPRQRRHPPELDCPPA